MSLSLVPLYLLRYDGHTCNCFKINRQLVCEVHFNIISTKCYLFLNVIHLTVMNVHVDISQSVYIDVIQRKAVD